jgi:hypothetical protein
VKKHFLHQFEEQKRRESMEIEEARRIQDMLAVKKSLAYNGTSKCAPAESLDSLLTQFVPTMEGRFRIRQNVDNIQRSYERRIEEISQQQALLLQVRTHSYNHTIYPSPMYRK